MSYQNIENHQKNKQVKNEALSSLSAKEMLNLAFQRSFNLSLDEMHKIQKRYKFIIGDQILDLIGSKDCSFHVVYKKNDDDINRSTHIEYKWHPLNSFVNLTSKREFERYDFGAEWNNLGYGKIEKSFHSNFGLCGQYLIEQKGHKSQIKTGKEVFNLDELAFVKTDTAETISLFAALIYSHNEQYLWINRPIGTIDGFDWIIVENFFTQFFPQVLEVPYGYNGAVTHRIDCDEAIASGRPLFEVYNHEKIPFSLAIKTHQPIQNEDLKFIKGVLEEKGSVVTHSHTHESNWGGSYEKTLKEIEISQNELKKFNISGINYEFAVSPFHQNSKEAIEALADSGIQSFVGGIICNDPEFIPYRAGYVLPNKNIVMHNQQCMFHGDTYRNQNFNLEIYKLAFDMAIQNQTFFGYLDHPQSSYNYGWESEQQRLNVHQEWIAYIKNKYNNEKEPILWASLEECLSFLVRKANIRIEFSVNEIKIQEMKQNNTKFNFKVKYKNKIYLLKDELVLNLGGNN